MDPEQDNIILDGRSDVPEGTTPCKDDQLNVDSQSQLDVSNNGAVPSDEPEQTSTTTSTPPQPMDVEEGSHVKSTSQSPVKVSPLSSPVKTMPIACASPSLSGAASPVAITKSPGTPIKPQESPILSVVPEQPCTPTPNKVLPPSSEANPISSPAEVEEVKDEPDPFTPDEAHKKDDPESEVNETEGEEVAPSSLEITEEPMEVKEEEKQEVPADNCDGELVEPEPAEPVASEQTPREFILEKISTLATGMENALALKEDEQIKSWLQRLTDLRAYADQKLDPLLFINETPKNQNEKAGPSKQTTKRRSTKKEKGEFLDYLNFSLKDIKGLPVFAKWPHSGWFYPGVVRDTKIDNWKSSSNVTVMFYDGLERDMKAVHVLPAELVPASSVLFDLDDEVDVVVVSSARDGDWVTFQLNPSDGDVALERGFDKLAIKGASMKGIKIAVDSVAPDTPQENISGKRSRGKSSLFAEDYVSSASRSKKARNTKSSDDDSTEATPSRTPSKRRQVNGSPTKSTPRRKGGKGK